jgi:hypothetical protein
MHAHYLPKKQKAKLKLCLKHLPIYSEVPSEKGDLMIMKTISHAASAREDTLTLIQSFTGQKNILTIPAEFIHYTGSIDCALFLSQLLYWSDKGKRKDGFIYKTYSEWEKEICLNEYKARKAANILKAKGILETKLKKANGSPTVHYRLDLNKFSESFMEFLKERDAVIEESLTETTTEITTEKKREELANASSHCESTFDDFQEDSNVTSNVSAEIETSHLASTSRSTRLTELPEDFRPDADMLYWAGTNYPYISAKDVTVKFINHFRARPKRLADWKAEWRKWMANERPSSNRSGGELSMEAFLNKDVALEDVQTFFYEEYEEAENYLLHRSEIEKGLPVLSAETMTNVLQDSVSKKALAMPVTDYYYSVHIYDDDRDYKEGVDEALKQLLNVSGIKTDSNNEEHLAY